MCFQLLEERATISLKTLVYKVGLLHKLMRTSKRQDIVLSPTIESVITVKSL